MPEVIDDFTGESAFLNNFYTCNGWTVEHHYQAAKTDDPAWKARILSADQPATAKQLGRFAPIREGWDSVKIDVMRSLLYIKFRDERLSQRLAATADARLVEANDHNDTFWGQVDGEGENWLGRLLMEVRRTGWIVDTLRTAEALSSPIDASTSLEPAAGFTIDEIANLDIEVPHGTITRYVNYFCRCDECFEATKPATSKIDDYINPSSGYTPSKYADYVPPKPPALVNGFGLQTVIE